MLILQSFLQCMLIQTLNFLTNGLLTLYVYLYKHKSSIFPFKVRSFFPLTASPISLCEINNPVKRKQVNIIMKVTSISQQKTRISVMLHLEQREKFHLVTYGHAPPAPPGARVLTWQTCIMGSEREQTRLNQGNHSSWPGRRQPAPLTR